MLRVLPPFGSSPLRQFAERPGWRLALLPLHPRACVHPCTRILVVAVTTVGVGARGSNDRKFGCVLDSWRSVPICLGLRLLRWTPALAGGRSLRVVACSRGRCGMSTIAQDCALGGALCCSVAPPSRATVINPLPRAFRHGAVHSNGADTRESGFMSVAGAGRRGATGQVETKATGR